MHISTFSHRRFLISLFLLVIGLFLLGFSLGQKESNTGNDTIWIVDNSMSMAVEDIADSVQNLNHSRLEVARSLVMSGVHELSGNHGVLIYARSP